MHREERYGSDIFSIVVWDTFGCIFYNDRGTPEYSLDGFGQRPNFMRLSPFIRNELYKLRDDQGLLADRSFEFRESIIL